MGCLSSYKIDFDGGKFLGYFDVNNNKVNDSYNSLYYIKKFDEKLYGKYIYTHSGFELFELYEAYEKDGEIIYNGKLVSAVEEEQRKENYKNGVLNGESEYTGYDYSVKGNYVNGKKEGEWLRQENGGIEYFENDILKKTEYINSNTQKIENLHIVKENGEIEIYSYNKKGELEQSLIYDENGNLKEGVNYTFFRNSSKESWFKSYDLGKAEYLGKYFPVEETGKILDLKSEIEKVYIPYTRGVKLFSIKEKEQEIFIIMVYENGYYGVKEIFEGYRKVDVIGKLGYIIRNGKYELYYTNNYYSEETENKDELTWQGYYSENQKDGTWENYLNGLIVERANYKKDKLNGLYQKYQWPYEYLVEEGNYADGEKIGEWNKKPYLYHFSE